jgi:drug/metabolite transporter (DMT)-like permease
MTNAPLSAIALRVLSVFLITAMAAVIHGLSPQVPVGQLIFWRSAVAVLPICAYMGLRGQFPSAFYTRKPALHITRSLFGAFSMVLAFVSLAYLPISTAEALAFLTPVVSLPMAAFLLKERISRTTLFATCLGFGGVVAMLWNALDAPGNTALIGVAAGLGYALTMAFVRVHIRKMTATEKPATIAFYFAVMCSLVGLCTAPFGWVAVSGSLLFWLIISGFLGGLAHIAATEAAARAPVAVLAPFEFTGLLWALGFDIVIFTTYPDALGIIGAGAITVAALVVTKAATAQHKA